MAQLQEQVQLLKETEGLVDTPPEKIVLEDAAAVKHKLDQTAAEVGVLMLQQMWTQHGASAAPAFIHH